MSGIIETTLPSVSLALTLLLTLIFGLRVLFGPKVPPILLHIFLGFVLGESGLGSRRFGLGSYKKVYTYLFSEKNKLILETLGAYGFIFSIFFIGFKINFKKPYIKKDSLALGLLSLVFCFSPGAFIIIYFKEFWSMNRETSKCFITVLYCLSVSSYPTVFTLIEHLNPSSSINQLLINSALYTEIVTSLLPILINSFFSLNNYTKETQNFEPLIWIVCFFIFFYFVFKPLLNVISTSSQKSLVFVLIATGLSNNIFDGFLKNLSFPSLILGFLTSQIPHIVRSLLEGIQDLSHTLSSVFVVLILMPCNVHELKEWGNELFLCVILISLTFVVTLLISFIITSICQYTWRESALVSLLMLPKGTIELALLSVLRDRKVLKDNAYTLLIMYVFGANLLTFGFTKGFRLQVT